MKQLFLITLLLTPFISSGQDKIHPFGDYTVRTGFCNYYARIEVMYQDSSLNIICDGEGGLYHEIDSTTITDDGIPDFVALFNAEDAQFWPVFIVSQKGKHSYKFYEPKFEYMSYDVYYENRENDHYEEISKQYGPFAIKDIDGDGKKDLLIHVLKKDESIKPIKGISDTITHATILQHLIPKHEIPQQ